MRFALFYHSLASDWNHGNAHFLRGVATELILRGHQVRIFEPADGWSRANLVAEHGPAAADAYRAHYPLLRSETYHLESLDLDAALDGADAVLVHEWNDPALVARIGEHHGRAGFQPAASPQPAASHGRSGFQPARPPYALFFHDTHHRAATAPHEMARYDLRHYDGALVFGEVLRRIYLDRGWARDAWTWHEAADTRLFRPIPAGPEADVVWVGNWGDGERTAELEEFLLGPVRDLGLRGSVYGVRYPPGALDALRAAGLDYRGWLPNPQAPRVFARHKVTVHVPRGPYVRALPGIPTIRVFEALACGIPLISAPWDDAENLFTPGKDYLVARDGAEMRDHLRRLLADPAERRALAAHGLRTIRARHTCAHRADQLLQILSCMPGMSGSASEPRDRTLPAPHGSEPDTGATTGSLRRAPSPSEVAA